MDTELIGVEQVAEILGYKPSTIRYKIAYYPDFPVPVRLTPRAKRSWKKDEIIAYRDMKQARAA